MGREQNGRTNLELFHLQQHLLVIPKEDILGDYPLKGSGESLKVSKRFALIINSIIECICSSKKKNVVEKDRSKREIHQGWGQRPS